MRIFVKRIGSSNFINSILFVAVALTLLILFPSVYYCQNEMLIFVIASLLMGIVCIYSIFKCKARMPRRLFLFLGGYILLTLIYWTLRGRGSLNCPYYLLFSFVILFMFNYYLLVCEQKKRFLSILVMIISLIACVSFTFWVFGSILGIWESNSNVYMNWNGYKLIRTFYYIYFEVQGANVDIFGIHFARRNCAIFAEAPMASFVFSLALLLNMNYTKVSPKIINSILVVTILSTFSTTGVIVLLLCILQKILNMKSRNMIGKAFIRIFSLIVVIVVLVLGYAVIARKLETTSGIVRSSMITSEFNGFLASPIYGNGFGVFSYGSSNSFFALLADGGIFLWGIYYIPMLHILIDRFVKKRCIDWFALNYLCMLAITVIQYYIITIFMVTMFWNCIIINCDREEYLQ